MATRTPVQITDEWTLVYDGTEDGVFVGGIQAVDNSTVILFVMEGTDSPEGIGGFALGSDILPFTVAASETVWAYSKDGVGLVVMG